MSRHRGPLGGGATAAWPRSGAGPSPALLGSTRRSKTGDERVLVDKEVMKAEVVIPVLKGLTRKLAAI